MSKEIYEKIVPSEIIVTAKASLMLEIMKELEEQDPTEEKAKAILYENSAWNDGAASPRCD